MKRLTISMSDKLFDSLSKIQNKSLFVRNLIEQGLDAGFGEEGIAPSSRDLDALRDEIGRLTDRLHGLEDQIDDIQLTLQSIPNDRNTEVQSTPGIEIKPLHDETVQGMRLVEEPVSKFSFEMPDIKLAEEIPAGSSIEAPEKQSNENTSSPFAIPESNLTEKMAQSSLFSQSPAVPAFETPQPETVPSPTPTKPADKKDRLEGNILMYMPHGAEIKRDIVKSLLSTRYDSNEIDAKINQMIADNTLSAVIREGKDYLVRL